MVNAIANLFCTVNWQEKFCSLDISVQCSFLALTGLQILLYKLFGLSLFMFIMHNFIANFSSLFSCYNQTTLCFTPFFSAIIHGLLSLTLIFPLIFLHAPPHFVTIYVLAYSLYFISTMFCFQSVICQVICTGQSSKTGTQSVFPSFFSFLFFFFLLLK